MNKMKLLGAAALLALMSVPALDYAEGVVPNKQTIGGLFLKGVQRRENVVLQIPFDGHSKVGATAGFTTAAANNLSVVTANQAMTTATLVTRPGFMHVGDYITGFYYVGNIAASGTQGITITANLRYEIPGATGPTDTSIATVTYVSRTYSALIDGTNVKVTGMAHAVLQNANYYLLTTISSPVSVTTTLQAACLSFTAQ